MGVKVSLALAAHSAFGVGLIGVLFHILLETLFENLKRRIMKQGIIDCIKKILGGALLESTLSDATPDSSYVSKYKKN